MTTTTAATRCNLSPYDANRAVTFSADGRSATVNRFGIGYGQQGFAGNVHFPTRTAADAAFEARLADLRQVYGTPFRNGTGRYVEEELPIDPGVRLLRHVRFVPLLKSGKRGKTIHTLHLYPINVADERIEAIRAALSVPVS